MMLEVRSLAEEQMDAADLAPETYDAVLHDLAHVNLVTMAQRPTLNFLARLPNQPLTILDVGFGDGDMLRAIGRWAARHRRDVKLVGIDLNPKSAVSATARTPTDLPITYVTGDYESLAGQGWDVILSSLVAHHMSHSQLITFLRFMDREARCGWLVNDLHRHGFAYLGYPLLARIMRWHRIVREDGQLSIARSYRPGEWPALLQEADVHNTRIFRAFPFRLCVEAIR